MIKWEYKEVYPDPHSMISVSEELNIFGQDGWELVNFTTDEFNAIRCCVFKRPLSNNDDDKNKILIHSKEEEYSEDMSNDGG